MSNKISLRPAAGLTAVALLPLQLVLDRIVAGVAQRQAELFERLGPHSASTFLIDPTDLPIMLLLQPDPAEPRLVAVWRGAEPEADCRIRASFLTLLALVDGRGDGDALFFSRDLSVEGNVEAVVTLRNALDDLDITLTQDIVGSSGLLRRPLQAALDVLRSLNLAGRQHVA